MSKSFLHSVFLLFLLLHSAWCGSLGSIRLRGELQNMPPLFRGTAEVVDNENHTAVGRAQIGPNGAFEFDNLPESNYTLSIRDDSGDEICEEPIAAGQLGAVVMVQFPQRELHRPPSGPVGVAQLLHPPARQAAKAFSAAQKFSDGQAYDKAAEQLEKAIQISPDYAEAHANLGVQHIRMGRYEQAIVELRQAAALGQETALVYCNIAVAQSSLGRYGEAVASARRSLSLDPSYAKAHMVLGGLLAMNPATLQEGIAHLKEAAENLPQARRVLATVLSQLNAAPAAPADEKSPVPRL